MSARSESMTTISTFGRGPAGSIRGGLDRVAQEQGFPRQLDADALLELHPEQALRRPLDREALVLRERAGQRGHAAVAPQVGPGVQAFLEEDDRQQRQDGDPRDPAAARRRGGVPRQEPDVPREEERAEDRREQSDRQDPRLRPEVDRVPRALGRDHVPHHPVEVVPEEPPDPRVGVHAEQEERPHGGLRDPERASPAHEERQREERERRPEREHRRVREQRRGREHGGPRRAPLPRVGQPSRADRRAGERRRDPRQHDRGGAGRAGGLHPAGS
jgi:hypothetical protein